MLSTLVGLLICSVIEFCLCLLEDQKNGLFQVSTGAVFLVFLEFGLFCWGVVFIESLRNSICCLSLWMNLFLFCWRDIGLGVDGR
jgi:hypothetical protein